MLSQVYFYTSNSYRWLILTVSLVYCTMFMALFTNSTDRSVCIQVEEIVIVICAMYFNIQVLGMAT